jgi:hypothetical protein
MSDFAQGALAGAEVNKQNPFNTLLSSFQTAQARRYKEDQERKKEEAELAKSLMILQYKDNYDRELAKETEAEKRKTKELELQGEATNTQNLIKSFGVGGGSGENNLPPGSTYSKNGLTIPLNPKLTQEQGLSIAGAENVEKDVTALKSLIEKHAGEPGAIAKTTLPYLFVGGDTEEIKRLSDQLRARIPFAKGGKQLTPFEAKTLFALLPQPGQSKDTITRNLDSFVTEFNRIGEIATKGTAGIGQTQQNQGGGVKSFSSEQEALASGVKGEVIINGRKARID